MYRLLALDGGALLDACRIVNDPTNEPFPPTIDKSPHAPPVGVPFSESSSDIDEWSAAIFAQLKTWPLAMSGTWTRWTPGYLALTISEICGRSIEPIVLDTDNDELTVSFGYWECHLSGPDYLGAQDNVESSSAEAIRLIEDWLDGRICTAVYYSVDDRWCGSVTINRDQLAHQLAEGSESLSRSQPTRIELRTPEREHWKHFQILRDGTIDEIVSRDA
jgi:hypothetical protein